MPVVNEEQILEVLGTIKDGDKDIVSAGMISGLQIKDGHVAFAIEVDPDRGNQMEPLRKEAEKTVYELDGVLSVTVGLTAEKKNGSHDSETQAQHHPAGTGP